jgi:hypothetical protein
MSGVSMAATAVAMDCGSATSSTSARPPISAACASSASFDRAARMTLAPAAAMWRAISRPMPRLAPATNAVFPTSEKVFTIFDYTGRWYNDIGTPF